MVEVHVSPLGRGVRGGIYGVSIDEGEKIREYVTVQAKKIRGRRWNLKFMYSDGRVREEEVYAAGKREIPRIIRSMVKREVEKHA